MSDSQAVVILVVDDDALVLDLAVSSLEDGGYTVVKASSAREAFAIAEQRIGELSGVVTDIDLGRGQPNGWDVARRVRELNPEMPIVYVTGDSAGNWSSQGVPHSVLLQKPFASADLVSAVAGLRKIN